MYILSSLEFPTHNRRRRIRHHVLETLTSETEDCDLRDSENVFAEDDSDFVDQMMLSKS